VETKKGEQKETGKQARNTMYKRQARHQLIQVNDLDDIKFFEVRHDWFKENFKSLSIYFKGVSV
jgi:hypothetical protein